MMKELYIIIFSLCILFNFSIAASKENQKNEENNKQATWGKMTHDVNHWVDRIGYPIDEEIKDLVIALNVFNISTTASCEGHLDHSLPFPWISISMDTPELAKLYEEKARLESLFADLNIGDLDEQAEANTIKELSKQYHLVDSQIKTAEEEILKPIHHILERFYQLTPCSYDGMFFMEKNYKFARLAPIGSYLQNTRTENGKKEKLLHYQRETKRLAKFLKELYFDTNE